MLETLSFILIGEHEVIVIVPAKGKATGFATFEYNDGAITDVTPKSGSTAGMCFISTNYDS